MFEINNLKLNNKIVCKEGKCYVTEKTDRIISHDILNGFIHIFIMKIINKFRIINYDIHEFLQLE